MSSSFDGFEFQAFKNNQNYSIIVTKRFRERSIGSKEEGRRAAERLTQRAVTV